MIITRFATTRNTEKYQVEVDKKYVEQFNENMKRWYTTEDWRGLSFTEFCEVYRNADSELGNRKVKRAYNSYNANAEPHFYEEFLCDVVRDYVSESLWDSYIETVGGETEDYEDEIDE